MTIIHKNINNMMVDFIQVIKNSKYDDFYSSTGIRQPTVLEYYSFDVRVNLRSQFISKSDIESLMEMLIEWNLENISVEFKIEIENNDMTTYEIEPIKLLWIRKNFITKNFYGELVCLDINLDRIDVYSDFVKFDEFESGFERTKTYYKMKNLDKINEPVKTIVNTPVDLSELVLNFF